MSKRVLRLSTHILTVAGLLLVVVGGAMWWRQSRLEAALLGQEERVLLAVTSGDQPPLMPGFDEAEGLSTGSAPTETVPDDSAIEQEPAAQATEVPEQAPRATALARELSDTTRDELAGTGGPPDGGLPPATTVPSRIIAPAINLDVSVVEMGWEVLTDSNGNSYSEWVVPDGAAGWHLNSQLPRNGGNTVLSGHHNVAGEVFRYIVDLEPGDVVELESEGILYPYVVEEKYIVKEKGEPLEVRLENNRFIEPTPDERLTLVSCWPYETNTHRVVVVARPVQTASSGVAPAPAP